MRNDMALSDVIKTASLEMADVMQLLPQKLLQPLVMAAAEGKSSHEIARQLNISELEARNRVTRAISFCRGRLQHRVVFRELARHLYN